MKTILMTLLVAAFLTVVAAAAVIYSGAYDVSASTPHGAFSRWLMETTMRSSVERRADGIDVPELGDESFALAGVNDFEEMCVQCHGAPGKEPGAAGQGLNPPAPDLAESAKEMSAAELFWVTRHGIRMTGMPAWGSTHTDDELWPVVALMTRLPELDAVAYQDLLSRAEGFGHHRGNATDEDHAHGDDDRQQPREDVGETAGSEESEEPEHDHSTHDH
jgi:mono/diheme cytochrome c family protein